MGKTHIVQDKSLGPGLHSQHYRSVRFLACELVVELSLDGCICT